MDPFNFSLAPKRLAQTINPWTWTMNGGQFGLINIDLGHAGDPDLEREILDRVGSYGRQIGRLGDALKVLLNHIDRASLSADEQQTLTLFEAQLIEIDQLKAARRETSKSAGN